MELVDEKSDVIKSDQEDYVLIEELISSYTPKSGVQFVFDDRRYGLFRPNRKILMPDGELIKWAGERFRETYEDVKDKISYERYLEEAKDAKRTEGVGRVVILSNDLQELDELIPGVAERIMSEHGKIVFLRNGLSEVPVTMALSYEKGELKKQPVIVDMFDYCLLFEDLVHLKNKFLQQDLSFPYSNKLTQALNIYTQIIQGNLLAVNYLIGQGNVPQELKNADLVINPSSHPFPLDEQASLLAPKGQLYINRANISVGGDYENFKLYDPKTRRLKANIITEIQK